MSNLLKTNLSYIQLLAYTKSKPQREALIQTVTRDQVKTVIEITYNIINLNVPLGKKESRKLVKHITILKEIANRKNTLKKITKLIKSNHLIILLIVKAALPALQSIFLKK